MFFCYCISVFAICSTLLVQKLIILKVKVCLGNRHDKDETDFMTHLFGLKVNITNENLGSDC